MAGRRLRLVRVNATELVGLEQTRRQYVVRMHSYCAAASAPHAIQWPLVSPGVLQLSQMTYFGLGRCHADVRDVLFDTR